MYFKLLLAFIIHSFLDFQILELIHFQKNFQGGARQSQGGANAPLKETLMIEQSMPNLYQTQIFL